MEIDKNLIYRITHTLESSLRAKELEDRYLDKLKNYPIFCYSVRNNDFTLYLDTSLLNLKLKIIGLYGWTNAGCKAVSASFEEKFPDLSDTELIDLGILLVNEINNHKNNILDNKY